MHNTLTIVFQSVDGNGYPKARILLDNCVVYDQVINNGQFDIPVTKDIADHTIVVDRYGKTDANHGQVLIIDSIKIDGVSIPDFLLSANSKFEFDNQILTPCRELHPNGQWSFDFCSPMLTWCLDEKIKHEAKFNQDFLFPWAYKLGPGQAEDLIGDISIQQERIKNINV